VQQWHREIEVVEAYLAGLRLDGKFGRLPGTGNRGRGGIGAIAAAPTAGAPPLGARGFLARLRGIMGGGNSGELR
jgi:hypothetical protein